MHQSPLRAGFIEYGTEDHRIEVGEAERVDTRAVLDSQCRVHDHEGDRAVTASQALSGVLDSAENVRHTSQHENLEQS